jgi:FhuF 2Fe-2S C-terminal domain
MLRAPPDSGGRSDEVGTVETGEAREVVDVEAALADISSFGPFYEVDTVMAGPGWLPMSGLIDGGDLAMRIDVTLKALCEQVERDDVDVWIAASLAQLNLTARLVSPVIALAARYSVVPQMSLAALRWQPRLGGAVPLGIRQPRAVRGAAPAELVALIDKHVLLSVVEPLMNAASRVVKISPQVLRGNVGSALASAAEVIATRDPPTGDRARTLVELLLEATSRAGTGHYVDGRFRRRSCCLYYRVGSSTVTCGDCVLGTV